MIPQDRHGHGLATGLTVEENVTIPHVGDRARPWSLGRLWRQQETDYVLEQYDVRPRGRDTVVATMSGGNQQKVMFGKWLLGKPRLLTLDEPTQAVDVGARAALLEATRQAAQEGAAVALRAPRRSRTSPPSATGCWSSRTASVARELAGPVHASTPCSTPSSTAPTGGTA